jgi:hypothetical protein
VGLVTAVDPFHTFPNDTRLPGTITAIGLDAAGTEVVTVLRDAGLLTNMRAGRRQRPSSTGLACRQPRSLSGAAPPPARCGRAEAPRSIESGRQQNPDRETQPLPATTVLG